MSATASLLKVLSTNAIVDQSGNLLVSGTTSFIATDANDTPIPFRIGGANGAPNRQAIAYRVMRTISNGSIDGGDLFLPNPLLTSPLYVLFRITIIDLTGGSQTVYRNVLITGSDANTWAFGDLPTGEFIPSVPTNIVTGPKGETGAQGVPGPPGQAGTATLKGSPGSLYVAGTLTVANTVEAATSWMNDCLRLNHDTLPDGTEYWYAGSNYPGIFPSDFGLTVDAYPGYFSPAQLLGVIEKVIADVNSDGDIPAALNMTGPNILTPGFYTSWDSAHHHASGDGVFWLPLLYYQYFLKSGSTAAFVGDAPRLETALGRVPRDSATGLVLVDPASPWKPWLFQEIVGLTGNVTLGSCLFRRCATQMAAMYTAAANTSRASYWTGVAAQIDASLGPNSALWDAAHGMFRAATIGCNSNIDHYGSALAVYLGIATPAQQTAISNYFVNNYATIFSNGLCLQTVNTAGGTDWAIYGQLNADNTVTPEVFGPGQYQNAYWSVANKWILAALAVTRPDLALQYATEGITNANPMQEWVNTDGTPQGCVANLVSPMGAGSRLLAIGTALPPSAAVVGVGNPYMLNGLYVNDGATHLKVGSLAAGARLILESAVGEAQECWFTIEELGSIRFRVTTDGEFRMAWVPWLTLGGIDFFSYGAGGEGLSNLVTIMASIATSVLSGVTTIGGVAHAYSARAGAQLNLDNGTAEPPRVKFLYADNKNFAIDTGNGQVREVGLQLIRFIADADEATSTIPLAVDVFGNASFQGFVATDHAVIRGKAADGVTLDGHLYKVDVVAGVLTTTLVS